MIVAFDTETALIRAGVCAPEMACLTWQTSESAESHILHASDVEPTLHGWLASDARMVGANVAFDLGVICANFPRLTDLVWDAYESGRVEDVLIREQLLDVAKGTFQGFHTPEGGWIKPKYALSDVAKRYGMQLVKPQSLKSPNGKMWDDPMHPRLRFQELIRFPVEEWDARAQLMDFTYPPVPYAKEDAIATMLVHRGQEQHVGFLKLQHEYSRRAWGMWLMSTWGVRTDAMRVAELTEKAEVERKRLAQWLEEFDLVRPNGSRNMNVAKALMIAVCREQNMTVPLTKTGMDREKTSGMTKQQIEEKYPALSEDACDATEDERLKAFADYGRWGSVVSKDCAALVKGTYYPIHTRIGLAATGRGTSSKPNMQNWGREVGPRECFVPRPLHVFIQADYEQLELRTLAQVCVRLFGRSKLAEQLNAGLDPHLMMASLMLGLSYEAAKLRLKQKDPEVVDARQTGKVANFGFPGGLGPDKLSMWARKTYNVVIRARCNSFSRCLPNKPCALHLKEMWQAELGEMSMFFEYVNRLCNNPRRTADVKVPISGWFRGDTPYCAACNTFFQNLGAAASGRGVWYVQKANYRDRASILFGSRMVVNVHDENFDETLEDALLTEKSLEFSRLMEKGANEFLPDVPIMAPPCPMRYWSKNAFLLKDKKGRMHPWDGEWICKCGEIFTGPVATAQDKEGQRVELKDCAHHTMRWLDTLAA